MNKSESKYFNTAIKMDEALISLLEKKDFEYITIKEICDAAKVNRSTFYLHYENTADLLRETTKYILDKHFSYYHVDGQDAFDAISRKIESGVRADLVFVTHEYLSPYLKFIKENRRIFKLSVKHFRVMNMGDVYDGMFRRIFEPILMRFGVPADEHPYVIKFYLTGIFAIVMEWLEHECRDEIDAIIKIINDCVLGERAIYG